MLERGSSGEPDLLFAAADDVAALELSSPAGLGSAVDLDRSVGEQGLDRSSGLDQTGQLEQLAQPDPRLADRYVLHRTHSVAGEGRVHVGVTEPALDAQIPVRDVMVLR